MENIFYPGILEMTSISKKLLQQKRGCSLKNNFNKIFYDKIEIALLEINSLIYWDNFLIEDILDEYPISVRETFLGYRYMREFLDLKTQMSDTFPCEWKKEGLEILFPDSYWEIEVSGTINICSVSFLGKFREINKSIKEPIDPKNCFIAIAKKQFLEAEKNEPCPFWL